MKKLAVAAAICIGVAALFYGYKLPTYYGKKGAGKENLIYYLGDISKKKGYSLSKKIKYYLFTDKLENSGRALNFENVEDCGDVCVNLAKNGYVDVFYSIKSNKAGIRQYYKQMISKEGEIKEKKISGKIYFEKFSEMNCEHFETSNHLVNYFNFKNKYSICFEGGQFVEAYVYLDATKSFFGGFPTNAMGTKYELTAKLGWFETPNESND